MEDRYIERNDEVEIDLQRLMLAVVQKCRQVFVTAVLCAVIALLGTVFLVKPQYQASVMFYVNNSALSAEGVTHGITSADIMASKSLVDSYLVILNTETTLTEVIGYADVDRTVREVQDMIEAAAVNGTELFQVAVTAEDVGEAERIAKAVAYVLPERISEIIEGTSAKVVDTVVSDSVPTCRTYVKNAVLGLLFGVLLSATVIVLRELFDSTIKCAEDITKTTGYPILAAIPHTDSAAASEAYKLLRTKLLHTAAKNGAGQVIGVTAVQGGEEASATASHLACALSQLDRRVVLVDCDLRGSAWEDREQAGLADYLSYRSEAEDLLHSSTLFGEEDQLTVISAGQAVPNPIELLSTPRVGQLITILRNTYDDVILALPPVGAYSDAMVIAKDTDGMLLTVRKDECDRRVLSEAVARLEYVDAEILGIVYHCGSESFGGTYDKKKSDMYCKT